MNIVFFGTSEFALPALREILNSRHKTAALVTQPDRKRGRNLKLSPPPAKVLARLENIPVWQPENASSPSSIDYIKKMDADLFVVVSFGQILTKELLSIPKFCSINLHASLLPKYRGAAPTNWAIINGDKVTGVTVIRMNEKMDEGDIILKREWKIRETDTNITLSEELSLFGARVLLEAADLIGEGSAAFEKQENSKATYAPKLKKEDGLINWSDPALRIHNKTRGLLPWPGAYTHYEGKILKILNTEISDTPEKGLNAGEVAGIIKDTGIVVRAGSGNVIIKRVQLEGKKDMVFDSFVRGHRIARGYKFL